MDTSLYQCIRDMDHKSQGVRVTSLSTLVNALTQKPQHQLVETNMVTMIYHCLGFLRKHKHIIRTVSTTKKKISRKEVTLALRTLALVALNVDDVDLAEEAFKEVVPVLGEYMDMFCDQAYNDFDHLLASELVDCLAMMGFFGTTDPKETERVMIMLWEYVLSFKTGKKNDDSLVAAIRAWSFLLSSLPKGNISGKHWRSCVDFFSDLLDHHGDYTARVLVASEEALYLILEIDVLHKFSHQEYSSDLSCTLGQSIREKISGYNYVKDADSGSFGMIIQMRMMERLLGDEGYTSHMENNNKLVMLFETMLRRNENNQGNVIFPPPPERARLVVKFFERRYLKDVKDVSFDENVCKRINKSESSSLSKARTQLLNKQRWHAYAQFYHYYSAY